MKPGFIKALRLASRGLLAFSATGLLIMTMIIGWQVFGRYVLNASPAWSEQAALVLMFWFVCLGAAAGVREGFHIRIVALARMLPQRAQDRVETGVQIILILIGLAMAVWGGELIARTWSHVIPTLGIPRGVAYLPLPISGILIALFALENIIDPPSSRSELAVGAPAEDL